MRRLLLGLSAVSSLGLCLGCEPPPSAPPAETPAPAIEAPVAPAPIAVPPAAEEQPAPEMVREEAKAGVGKRGGDIPAEPTAGAIITTPTDVYFRAQEQFVFNVQIPQALQLFEASEGRPPRSEDEFMTRIVRDNNIVLPELPAGHKYVYDVEKKQLMVEHPE